MKPYLLFIFSAFSSFVFAQSDVRTYDSQVPVKYFDYSLKLVKQTPGFSPPVAARAFGYMGLSIYESMVSGMPTYTTTKNVVFGFDEVTSIDSAAIYHWPTVANNALATIVDSLFRTTSQVNKDTLLMIKNEFNQAFEYQLDPQVFLDSKNYGIAIAQDVFDYSRTDGAHTCFASNFPPNYVPPVGEGLWIPFGSQLCLQPFWGNNRPFIEADSSAETISPPHPEFSTTPGTTFYEAVNEVYTTGLTLTPEETTIAQYWADGGGSITPPGHSISILNNVLTNENANLEIAAVAYAKLGIAVSDAFLACWKTKYLYNLCRPVTYIREHIDTSWLPFISTPPFPEYPSGHSSQSGAMSGVMTAMFGGDYAFTDNTHGLSFGGPRSFDSFEEAAREAADSRLYGGIHYSFGNEAGLTLGTIVAENVNELFSELFVAVEPVIANSEIKLFPNPAFDNITISGNEKISGRNYSIIDQFGKVVAQGRLENENQQVSIRNLAAGMYAVQIEGGVKAGYRFVKS